MRHAAPMLLAAAVTALGACAADPRPAPSAAKAEAEAPPTNLRYGAVSEVLHSREPFPGVRIDLEKKTVEFDAAVPIDVNNKDATPVFLELIACSPDTREHESLVVTDARPSDIHTALLLIGLNPGKPGAWKEGEKGADYSQPTGDPVRVEFVVERDGKTSIEPAQSWVVRDRAGTPLPLPGGAFVFAGSRFVTRQGKEWYDADGAGTVIGLCAFGSETIAYPQTISPEASMDEPVWVADPKRTPAAGTRVTVRLSPAAPAPGR